MHTEKQERNHGDAAQPGATREIVMDVGNMLKAFIGLNFISVAYAFSKAGMLRGAIGLIFIAVVTEHCCLLLIQVKNSMPGHALSLAQGGYTRVGSDDEDVSQGNDETSHRNHDGTSSKPVAVPTYGDIAYFVGGRRAEQIVNAALVITQFGYCVGYLIFISQTLHNMLPQHVQDEVATSWVVLMPIPVLLLIAMLTSIRSLGPFSLAANAALLFGFVAVVVFISRHFKWQPSHPSLSTLPLFFGQITAALEGIGLVVPVETSMRNRDKFPLVLRIALGTLAAVLMIVGVLAYATYGEDTHSIILQNIGISKTAFFVKAVLLVGILFTYPLQIIPVFHFAESFLKSEAPEQRSGNDGTHGGDLVEEEAQVSRELLESTLHERMFLRDGRKIAMRTSIVTLTAVVAMFAGRSFGLFQSFVGSIGASFLAYTAPALLHYKVFRDELSSYGRAKNIMIAVFGVAGAIVGTFSTVLAFAKGDGVMR